MKSRYLTDAEIALIFANLPTERRLIFEISLATGLRIGDVLKIRARDVRSVGRGEMLIKFTAEKTGKRGECVLNGTISKHLFSLRRGKKGFLWASRSKSGHITRQTAWNWFKAAAKAAKIEIKGVSPHALRKSFAVKLRHERGIEAAQRALQHTNCAQTAIYAYSDIYAGADPYAPVLWCQIDELIDLLREKLIQRAKKDLS